jgi:gamma-glutamylcyclotransferase (GGCT)/AIG2-like uncharacterized protein YtfP
MEMNKDELQNACKQVEKEIREAYIFLREKNQTIPSETLQFMLDASLEKLNKPQSTESETKGRGTVLGEVFEIDTVDELIDKIDYYSSRRQTLKTVALIRKAMNKYANQR